MSASQDGSESVDQFLARIASVKEGRDQASEERSKRIEEDFLKNRKERQARRLERARSLSPSKTGPSLSSPVPQTAAKTRDAALNPPVDFSPRASTLSRSNAVSARTSPKLEPKQPEQEPIPLSPNLPLTSNNAAGLSRSGTLSWQQRPPRDGGVSRPRPLSSIGTIRHVAKVEDPSNNADADPDRPEPTRQEIAASLRMKDPSWFRQTQDRGTASAAFRKNQVEDSNTVEHSSRSSELPGMSRDVARSASRTPGPGSESATPTRERQLSPSLDHKVKREPSPIPVLLSGMPNLEPSPQQSLRADTLSESTPNPIDRSGSTLAGRPASPTKGLGGFVESAMMKRSDSISKRWSVQASAGLKRGDSVAGIRPLSGARSMHAPSLSKGNARDGSPSPMPTSRPESRERIMDTLSRSATPDRKPDAVSEDIPNSEKTATAERPQTPVDDQLSRSPSRAADSKRWSPTKSSWLESALLSKPEPPKLQPAKEDIPAWKATLQRNKASRDLSPDKTVIAANTSLRELNQDLKKPTAPAVAGKRFELKAKDAVSEPSGPEAGGRGPDQKQPASMLSKPKDSQDTKDITSEPDTSSFARSKINSIDNEAVVVIKPLVDEKVDKKPPPIMKPKPQTPPKTDFRSTLRSRAPLTSEGKDSEPEFRSIFGKLKPAQTSNYVAPDTLKSNILTGKAALNTTGGPQKTQRVDEFKESILQKKEAMKASAEQKKEAPVSESQSAKPAPAVPEALARRKTLNKAPVSIEKLRKSVSAPQAAAQAPTKPLMAIKPKPSTILSPAKPVASAAEPDSHGKAAAPNPTTVQVVSDSNSVPSRSTPRDTGRPKDIANAEPREIQMLAQTQARSATAPVSPVSVMPPKDELPTGSKLASRLNPNLAALISRGGSPRPSPAQSPSTEQQASGGFSSAAKTLTSDESAAAGELTHMTKGRARGPKRRAPKSQPAPATVATSPERFEGNTKTALTTEPKIPTSPSKSFGALRDTFTAQPAIQTPSAVRTMPAASPITNKVEEQVKKPQAVEVKPKPSIAVKSPELRNVSSTISSQQSDGPVSKPASTEKFEIVTDADVATKPVVKAPVRELPKTPKPVLMPMPLTPSKSRINTPKPAPSPADSPAKPQSPKPVVGPELATKLSPVKSAAGVSALTSTPLRQSKAASAARPASPVKKGTSGLALAPIISVYFPNQPEKHQRADFDAHGLLVDARKSDEKIRTKSHTIHEVNGDGKKSAIPPQQEHILFEESMYLVTHSFESDVGVKSSEVYLWCGDEVADAAIEDAQLFCKKDARDHNAKLEVIRQGKESARFFQALGGILIVRRGRSSSLYMLRGRRHLGHIAFDEVELTTSSLCSGFTHLISAKFGKLYLWKGKGSGADEVGCARLIGMDLGLTGEIEEVVEGEEPSSFWESFSERSRSGTWSPDWALRAENQCYPTALYKVDYDRPKASAGGFWGLRAASPPKASNKIAIEAVTPFCDRDLEPTNVYVVDAYRSIYVILNPQAVGKSAEIVAAMDLAQELAMLAPSIQDRSVIPSCYVVFGEPPPDVKVCFRKWSESRAVMSHMPSACVRLEEVMEALGL